MNPLTRKFLTAALALLALGGSWAARADEAAIRKNLAARIPNLPHLDEVAPAAMPGLYEVRLGTQVVYTDAEGNFLIQGDLVDTRTRKNLTEERVNKLTAIDFNSLNFKNAFTIVRGDGKRKMVLFEDPNCGYCKRFEKDLQQVNNITVHVFLIPILGEDSITKARQIWCSDDRGKAWMDWMVGGVAPKGNAICNTEAITANLAFAKKYRITGTPTLLFADGTRVPGAISAAQVEQKLSR